MQATAFDTKPLLRPKQVEDLKSEIASAEAKMGDKNIQDKGEARKQWMRLKKNLDDQAPRPPQSGKEEGDLVKREKSLLDEILEGMPSQEEMRKAPPGAVDKHVGWERRNKPKILEWKNIRLRLRPGEAEAANLERYRPRDSTLNMDNAYVQGKSINIPEAVGVTVTFNETELQQIKAKAPEIADMLGLMTNEQRAKAKEMLKDRGVFGKIEKAKRSMSPEHKAKLIEGARRARESRKAA